MLALLALWEACHRSERRGRWLAAASLAYGLAIGARPNLLFGAVILLVPVAQAWRERRRVWVPLLAATGPITFIGLGLLLYNFLRFDHPGEFGTRYLLDGVGAPPHAQLSFLDRVQYFGFDCLGFNSWVYFLAPARWGAHFPFVHNIQLPRLPARFVPDPEHPFGVLSNIPLVWLAVAAPLAWRGRPADVRRLLCGFLAAVALLFATSALLLICFPAASVRYEMEFCPALVLLAVVGILGLERALADRPAWQGATRWAWGLLLAFSLAFNLLASAIRHAEYHWKLGTLLLERGQVSEAAAHLQKVVVLRPDDAGAYYNLGIALDKRGQMDEAIRQIEQALHLKSDYADAHNKLGTLLLERGQVSEAVAHLQKVVVLRPDDAGAHYNLGIALDKRGQMDEAIRQLEEAIRLRPDYAEAHYNLGTVLDKQGQIDEAIRHYQEAIRLKPDHADARNNLGAALITKGQIDEAIRHYQEAVRLKPDHADARNNLGLALGKKGQTDEAIRQLDEAIRLKPDYAEAHYNLGIAFYQEGRLDEAIRQLQEALKLKPDYAEARRNLDAMLAAGNRSSAPPGPGTNR